MASRGYRHQGKKHQKQLNAAKDLLLPGFHHCCLSLIPFTLEFCHPTAVDIVAGHCYSVAVVDHGNDDEVILTSLSRTMPTSHPLVILTSTIKYNIAAVVHVDVGVYDAVNGGADAAASDDNDADVVEIAAAVMVINWCSSGCGSVSLLLFLL